jgi:magnesium-transporting ATPase (P-type)
MITGDRSDTALNVAASCNLFRPDKDSLCALLGAESTEDVNHMLGSFLPSGESVVAVDGVTLGYILQSSVSSARFLQVCGAARAVICSRVTPKQKGEVGRNKFCGRVFFFLKKKT